MTVLPSLSPCPFCSSHLMLLGPSRAQHPPADCILSGREIAAREFREWNKRAVGAEACQLCSCTAEGGPVDMPRAWLDVMGERIRQMAVEGWTAEHDDEHASGQMAGAAACYALTATDHWANGAAVQTFWPWDQEWWKPSDRRRNLVKGGALIFAEIERLDRAALAGGQLCSCTVEMAECAAFSAGYEAGERDGRGAGDLPQAAQDVLAERQEAQA